MKIDKTKVLHLMVDRGIGNKSELARRMDISPQGLYQVMDGGGFTGDTLGAMCRELYTSPNDVLAWEMVVSEGPRRAS